MNGNLPLTAFHVVSHRRGGGAIGLAPGNASLARCAVLRVLWLWCLRLSLRGSGLIGFFGRCLRPPSWIVRVRHRIEDGVVRSIRSRTEAAKLRAWADLQHG